MINLLDLLKPKNKGAEDSFLLGQAKQLLDIKLRRTLREVLERPARLPHCDVDAFVDKVVKAALAARNDDLGALKQGLALVDEAHRMLR